MGFLEDFVILPNPIKYIVLIAIFSGLTISIPFIGFSIADIFSPVITGAFSILHVTATFGMIFALIVFTIALLFINEMEKSQKR